MTIRARAVPTAITPPSGHKPLAGQWRAASAIVLVAGLGAAIAIASFTWSQHVAAVRAQIQAVDARIATAQAQVGRLRTELDIRTRLVQQARWATQLGLQTPDSLQYGADGPALRAIADGRRTAPAAPAAPIATPTCPAGACETPSILTAKARGYAERPRQEMDALVANALR